VRLRNCKIGLSWIYKSLKRKEAWMDRNILLVEPNYKNKYPPLGLMKISAYHKHLEDNVVFFKGDYNQYFFDEKFEKCISKIKIQSFEIDDWNYLQSKIKEYLKYRRKSCLAEILSFLPFNYIHTVENILRFYSAKYKSEKKWDRVYVTSLFTYNWKQTIEAVEFAKKVVKSIDGLFLGGVAASLIPDLFAKETGLIVGKNVIVGLLDRPRVFDDNDIIIDEITPDYSILETIEHHYPLDTGYLTYMTKGCTRTCSFCAVPKLEPTYKNMVSVKEQIKRIAEVHGARKDLILMDNNVLGSSKFPEIVQEILDMGFEKGAQFVEPNRFMILTDYLIKGNNEHNEKKYLQKIFTLLSEFGYKRIKKLEDREKYLRLLADNGLDSLPTFTKESLLNCRDVINEFIEKYRNKSRKQRYVDFNQGIDCRYIDEDKMKLLSQLPIRPMRIAFDYLSLRKPYENAVRLADKYGVRELSNYILFNYRDKPIELWQRLKINSDLNRELKTPIYSFPMKFIPLYGEDSKTRTYIGKHWNRKYVRAIQFILHVTGGVVSVNPTFFERAFGKNPDEYFKILMMPESYIMYREHFEQNGNAQTWWYQYKNLNSRELKESEEIIHSNDFFSLNGTTSKAVIEFLKHYQFIYRPERDSVKIVYVKIGQRSDKKTRIDSYLRSTTSILVPD
ncbi:MAG: hypothetical protein ACE5JB_10745, partial [bacterium]